MAITNKKEGVWGVDQVYDKQNQGSIWSYAYQHYLWGWGRNDEFGQLGLNDIISRSSATQVPGTNWAQIATSPNSAHAIKQDGTLWTWGKNVEGTFGIPSYADNALLSSPVQVTSAPAGNKEWVIVRKDGNHNHSTTLSVKESGIMYTWGSNTYGQLGHNDRNNRDSPIEVPGGSMASANRNWSKEPHQVSVNGVHSLAMRTDGTLWTWGYNNQGMLGLNQSPVGWWYNANLNNKSSPTQLTSTSDWKACHAGLYSNWILNTSGKLYSWGQNTQGQLGQNDRINRSSPTQIGSDTDWDKLMSNGYSTYHFAAIKTNGTLWTWGQNQYGELGQNSVVSYSSPVQIPGTTWSHAMPGGGALMAYKTDGTLWSWGWNWYGTLGHNDRVDRSSPVQVVGDWDMLQFENSTNNRYGFSLITKEL